jgi:hypothetical protein
MKFLVRFVVALVVALAASTANATFHTFRLQQIFSNADGSVQFVVLVESAGSNGENLWAGHVLRATGPGGTWTFTFPTNLPDDSTAGRSVLVATAGFAALGIVTPDYVVPNGFLSLANGSVDFAGVDSITYTALPADGVSALSRSGTPVPNLAKNFDGDSASVGAVAPAAANYQGLWYKSPAESEGGWGLNIAHQGDIVFATWFTYDATGKGWWLSMTAGRQADGSFAGTLSQTTGPAFSAVPFDPARVARTDVGTATLRFGDSDNGTFAYTVNGISQSKTITRQKFGPLPTCTFGGLADLSAATNYQDLWWASPPGSESGWGLNLTHEGSVIFATWFTYDADGSPLWLSGTLRPAAASPPEPPYAPGDPYSPNATAAAPDVYSGTLVRTRGPAFSAVPFNPANVTRADVGTATITFTSGNAATFAYTVNGVAQSKAITRQVFRAPGTACR